MAFVAGVALFWPALGAASLPLIEFSIRPNLCVLTAQDEVCRDELEISWSTPEPQDVCLYSDQDREPLRCWQDAHGGEYSLPVSTASDIHFFLRSAHSEDLLMAKDFEVVQDDRAYRRKRRNPWSFF